MGEADDGCLFIIFGYPPEDYVVAHGGTLSRYTFDDPEKVASGEQKKAAKEKITLPVLTIMH